MFMIFNTLKGNLPKSELYPSDKV